MCLTIYNYFQCTVTNGAPIKTYAQTTPSVDGVFSFFEIDIGFIIFFAGGIFYFQLYFLIYCPPTCERNCNQGAAAMKNLIIHLKNLTC
jgi:hypothetical protein